MFSVIPFLLIILALAAILVIVVRKFPSLSLLDVENMPERKVEQKRDEMIRRKVEVKHEEKKRISAKRALATIEKLKGVQKNFRLYVGKVERKLVRQAHEKQEKKDTPEVKEERVFIVSDMVRKGDVALAQSDYEQAENAYIGAIRLDIKNTDAYHGLVNVYIAHGQLPEAKETCKYLLQLTPRDERAHVQMAQIYEEENDMDSAITSYRKAVQLNPGISQRFAKLAELFKEKEEHADALEAISRALALEGDNPRYLDSAVEIAILGHDSDIALELLEKLRHVNPDNQKLDAFKQRIEQMTA